VKHRPLLLFSRARSFSLSLPSRGACSLSAAHRRIAAEYSNFFSNFGTTFVVKIFSEASFSDSATTAELSGSIIVFVLWRASSSSFFVLFIDRERASSFSPLLVVCGSARFRVAVLRFLLRLFVF
jgi:hypothetical protein